jgi:hypothetical protein
METNDNLSSLYFPIQINPVIPVDAYTTACIARLPLLVAMLTKPQFRTAGTPAVLFSFSSSTSCFHDGHGYSLLSGTVPEKRKKHRSPL